MRIRIQQLKLMRIHADLDPYAKPLDYALVVHCTKMDESELCRVPT